MRQVFLAEITAYDPREDELVTLRMCSGGQGHVAFPEFPNEQYIPCIASAPTQTRTVTDNGIPGQITIDYGAISIRFTRDHRNTHWRRYDFDGYPCRLLYGEYGAPYSTYKQIPAGRVGSLDVQTGNLGELALLGPDVELKKDVLTASYAGTGGAEGQEELKGTLKPFAIGRCENIQALLIDPVNLIWQYHGYGPTQDVEAAYENALTLGPAKLVAATYDELAGYTAEQLPPGTWAKAPAVGMFRFGGEPIGKVTADVVGTLDNGFAPQSVGAIGSYMLRVFGGIPQALIDRASAAKMDRDFPHTWGSYIDARSKPEDADENEPSYSVGDFVREATSHVAGYLFADALGVWHFGRNVSTKEPTLLRSGRGGKPVVIDIAAPATSTRVHRVRVGGRRCFSVHSDSEISSALKDAVEGTLEVIGGVKQDIEKANENANAIKHQLPDLVGPLLRAPIDKLSALNLEYGTAGVKLSQALNAENLVAIRAIGTRVDEAGSKIAEEVLQLTSRLSDNEKAVAGIDIKGPIEAGLSELRRAIANANYASSEVVDVKIANYGDGVTAWQTNEERVRSERDKAIAEDIEKMGVRITDEVGGVKTSLEGSFNDLRELVIEDGEATAKRIDEMGTRITTEVDGVTKAYEGAIRTIEEARAEDGRATAGRIDTISSSVDGLIGPNGIIQNIQKTQADDNGARAEETRNLQSKLDDLNIASLEEKLNTYATKTDGIGAQYVLKLQTDSNGVRSVAGMGLAIEDNVSAIAFTADSFRLTTPGSFPQQVFYADSEGVYMPNVRVDKLTYGSLVDQFAKNQSILDPISGYQQIPGGPMMMWGRFRQRITYESTFSVSFPIPFPNQCLCFNATPYLAVFNNERDLWIQNIGQTSRFGATVATQAARRDDQYLDGFDWIAFGY